MTSLKRVDLAPEIPTIAQSGVPGFEVTAWIGIAVGIILLTSWSWIDPVMSLVICLIILWSTYGLLRSSVSMSLNAVPPGVDVGAVRAFLQALPGVTQAMTSTSGRSAQPKPR